MKPMLQRVLPLLLSLCLLLSGCSGIPSSADLAAAETASSSVSLENIPAYTGSPYVVLEENQPDFSPDELTEESFESYSSLDSLGRCGPAVACIGKDLMPQEERESISEVKPSGWQNEAYDFVEGGYVYNRCHLIGFQLTGAFDVRDKGDMDKETVLFSHLVGYLPDGFQKGLAFNVSGGAANFS